MTEMDILKERYLGSGASSYNRKRHASPRWQKEHEIVRRYVEQFAGMSVLDLPAGTGRFIPLYKEFDCKMIGVDISPDMLKEAEAEAERDGYMAGTYVEANVIEVDPATIEADLGVCMRFLNWLPAPKAEKAFSNTAAACRQALVVGITSIDEAKFDDKTRPAIERRLARAHTKPGRDGIPPNGPHSGTAFKRWVNDAGFVIKESELVVTRQDNLTNEIHYLVRA